MIFVTVGTTGFDDLIRYIDQTSNNWGENLILQIGAGFYVPQNFSHFRFAPSLETYYNRASLVISHGGLATLSETLQLGKPLVAIEDRSQPDRHQREILQIWSEKKYLIWCRELEQLQDCIEKARSSLIPYPEPQSQIHTKIVEFLNRNCSS